jgi:diguanylate cyclase (GGDEF)-like protein/PAS domain S-box-containing protein
MVDLSLLATDTRAQIDADAVCLWFGEADSIAVPVAASPIDWISRPWVLTDITEPYRLLYGAPAVQLLPLPLRGQETLGQTAAVLLAGRQLSPGVCIGMLALWRSHAPAAIGLHQATDILLSVLGQTIWQCGVGASLLEDDPHMHALANALPQGIVIVPLDGRMGFVNQTGSQWLGISQGETAPDTLSFALSRFIESTENTAEVIRFVKPLLAGLPATGNEHSTILRMQYGKALRLTISPIGESQINAWAWLLDDISAETALQDKLTVSEHKFHQFYQTMRDAVAFYDRDGLLVEGNEALRVLLDWPQWRSVHAVDMGWQPETWRDTTQACLQNGVAPIAERQLPRADGAVVFVESTCNVYRDKNGDVAGWYEVMHDITLRKAREAQLRLVANVFERHADSEVLTDSNHVILTCNDAFIAMTGYKHEELCGKTPKILQSGKHDSRFYDELRQQIHTRGWWQGGIWDRTKSGELFFKWLSINALRDNAGNITHFIGLYREAEAVRAAEDRITYLATHDTLTQLHNRQWLEDRLANLLTSTVGKMIGVAVISLDNLPKILAARGRDAGDELIRCAASRLRELGQDAIASARLTEDRFVLVFEAVFTEQLHATANYLLQGFNAPQSGVMKPGLVVSLGMSVYPEHSDRADALLLNAQAALEKLKQMEGRGACLFYSADMHQEVTRRFQLEHDLRLALEQDELFLQYQPQIAADSRRVEGCEALVRWRRDGVVISPAEFIPVAERSELIFPLTHWVLRRVCEDLRNWDCQGLSTPTISINISARHFQLPDMVEDLLAIVQENGIQPRRLCLEITEGVLAEPEKTTGKLLALQAAGFCISIDDFGTGFSSLAYLRYFKLDEVKIDRSFAEHLFDEKGDRAIVLAILAIAKSLGMRVVAEGIETKEQADFFRANGGDLMQGYLFFRPLGQAELINLFLDPAQSPRQSNLDWT